MLESFCLGTHRMLWLEELTPSPLSSWAELAGAYLGGFASGGARQRPVSVLTSQRDN